MLDSSVKEPGAWLRIGGSVGHSSYTHTHTGEGALESRAMYARLVGDAVKSDFKGLRNQVGSSVGQQEACISKARVLNLGWLKL